MTRIGHGDRLSGVVDAVHGAGYFHITILDTMRLLGAVSQIVTVGGAGQTADEAGGDIMNREIGVGGGLHRARRVTVIAQTET